MSLLSCQHLSLGYDGREILHDLNFEVNAGDYLCIVGENGSGKSIIESGNHPRIRFLCKQ